MDTETSGLSPIDDRIWEIAFVGIENGQIAFEAAESYYPEIDFIHPKITQVTGIRMEDLRGRPTFKERLPAIREVMQKYQIFAAYNAPFDKPFIANEFARSAESMPDRPWLDPLVWARYFQKYDKSRKLAEVAERCGITVDITHRAQSDAYLAACIMLHYRDKLPEGVEELLYLQEMWRRQQKPFGNYR